MKDIVNMYVCSNEEEIDINTLKKVIVDLHADLNTKNMLIEKHMDTIKQLSEKNDYLIKSEADLL